MAKSVEPVEQLISQDEEKGEMKKEIIIIRMPFGALLILS